MVAICAFICISLCCLSLAVAETIEPQPSARCDAAGIASLFEFDTDTARWSVREGNECGANYMAAEEFTGALGGKRILFVGDSTVRNIGLTVLASMCNPRYLGRCKQKLSWAFLNDTTDDAFHCGMSTGENRCDKVTYSFIEIPGLTTGTFYSSRADRRRLWSQGLVPPMVKASFAGTELYFIEGGCARHTDGLWKIFSKLAPSINASSSSTGEPTPSLGKFDQVITSGGFHCSYQQYRGVNWYLALARIMPSVQKTLGPVMWMEPTHCYKGNTGHFFMYGRHQKLNYRKLASCDYIAKHIPGMTKSMEEAGVLVSRSRRITRDAFVMNEPALGMNDTERRAPCVFVDPMHPTLQCYQVLVRLHLQTLIAARKGDWSGGPRRRALEVGLRHDDSKEGVVIDPLLVAFLTPVVLAGYFLLRRIRRNRNQL